MKGIPVNSQHYFHPVSEEVAPGTNNAQRATFAPTQGNLLGVRCLESKRSSIRAFGRALQAGRAVDLSLRTGANNISATVKKWGAGASAQMQLLRLQGDKHTETEQKEKGKDAILRQRDSNKENIDRNHYIKRERLELKKDINAVESKAELDGTVEHSNNAIQRTLRNEGYEHKGYQSASAVAPVEAKYVFGPTHHKLRTNYTQPSDIAQIIAANESAASDRGEKGLLRRLGHAESTLVVGAHNGLQYAKQVAYKVGAGLTQDEGKKLTFVRHEAKAKDMRILNNAALKGNASLAATFQKVNDEREQFVARNQFPGYVSRPSHLPGASFSTRTFNDYFKNKKLNEAGEEVNPQLLLNTQQVEATAHLLIAAKSLWFGSKELIHDAVIRKANFKLKHNFGDREKNEASRSRHQFAKFSANFKRQTGKAALKGELESTGENLYRDYAASLYPATSAGQNGETQAGNTGIKNRKGSVPEDDEWSVIREHSTYGGSTRVQSKESILDDRKSIFSEGISPYNRYDGQTKKYFSSAESLSDTEEIRSNRSHNRVPDHFEVDNPTDDNIEKIMSQLKSMTAQDISVRLLKAVFLGNMSQEKAEWAIEQLDPGVQEKVWGIIENAELTEELADSDSSSEANEWDNDSDTSSEVSESEYALERRSRNPAA